MENNTIILKAAKRIHPKQELMNNEFNSIVNVIKNNIPDINKLVDETKLDDDSSSTTENEDDNVLQKINEMEDTSENINAKVCFMVKNNAEDK